MDPHIQREAGPGERKPKVGDIVVYHDEHGRPHNALVVAGWSPTCCNLVYASSDETKQDAYGRQIERDSSVVHKSVQPAHGKYFRWPDEEPNPVIQPASS